MNKLNTERLQSADYIAEAQCIRPEISSPSEAGGWAVNGDRRAAGPNGTHLAARRHIIMTHDICL